MTARSLLVGITLAAATTTSAQAPAISQSYSPASSGISAGALLSRATSPRGAVTLATTTSTSGLVGVAAASPVLELSNNGKDSVQVAVSGLADALVSDANGSVVTGDKITASPLAGIGMKAMVSGEIVGTAQASLDSVKTVTRQVKNKDGRNVAVHVGLIPVQVNVVYYTAVSSGGSVAAYVPLFLQNLANTVAGRAVSPLRVLIATSVMLLGFCAVTIMLYGGVRSGVVSLGRNPLAAPALRRGMVDVLIAALGVLMVVGVMIAAIILL